MTKDVIYWCIIGGIVGGTVAHHLTYDSNGSDIVHVAEAATTTPVAKEVRVEVKIDWTKERIEKEIRDTFPEDPETAVKIAKCESGLKADIQSRHQLSYGQERSFGIFQIHAPDWHEEAVLLGYDDYKTDPGDNIKMARYIYDEARGTWRDWSCYNNRML